MHLHFIILLFLALSSFHLHLTRILININYYEIFIDRRNGTNEILCSRNEFIISNSRRICKSAGVATMKGDGDGVRMANEWSILKLDVL